MTSEWYLIVAICLCSNISTNILYHIFIVVTHFCQVHSIICNNKKQFSQNGILKQDWHCHKYAKFSPFPLYLLIKATVISVFFMFFVHIICLSCLLNYCDTEVTRAVTWQGKVGSGGINKLFFFLNFSELLLFNLSSETGI